MVSRTTSQRFHRWEWGRQIGEHEPAYAWSRFITPLYGVKAIGLMAGLTYAVSSTLGPGVYTGCHLQQHSDIGISVWWPLQQPTLVTACTRKACLF